MLKKVAFTMYPIRDVARARDFHENALGLPAGSVDNQGERYWVDTICRAADASRSPISSRISPAPPPAARSRSRWRISMRSWRD